MKLFSLGSFTVSYEPQCRSDGALRKGAIGNRWPDWTYLRWDANGNLVDWNGSRVQIDHKPLDYWRAPRGKS